MTSSNLSSSDLASIAKVKKYFGNHMTNFIEHTNVHPFTSKRNPVECDYQFIHDEIEYTLHFLFPENYPFCPPIVHLSPPVNDPMNQISPVDGRLQFNILDGKFSPALKLHNLVDQLQSYLDQLA